MLPSKQINIDCASIELLENGIILIMYEPDYEVELKDVKEVEKAFIQLSDSSKIYCLMDTSGRYINFTSEAQKFLSSEASIVQEGKIKASAIIINNLPNRLFAKLFSNFFKPKFPMKIFSNQKDALNWLKSEME